MTQPIPTDEGSLVRPGKLSSKGDKKHGEPSRLRSWLKNRFTTRRSRLAELEELSWEGEETPVRNLYLTLRVRYEESRNAAIRDSRFGSIFSAMGILGAVGASIIAYFGWRAITTINIKGVEPINPNIIFWPKMISTSGAVLLSLAAATIILKVGDRFSQRSAAYLREANQTRCIEAAVRLVFMGPKDDQQKAVQQLVDKILTNQAGKEDSELQVSAVPELVQELKDVVIKALDTLVEASKLKGK